MQQRLSSFKSPKAADLSLFVALADPPASCSGKPPSVCRNAVLMQDPNMLVYLPAKDDQHSPSLESHQCHPSANGAKLASKAPCLHGQLPSSTISWPDAGRLTLPWPRSHVCLQPTAVGSNPSQKASDPSLLPRQGRTGLNKTSPQGGLPSRSQAPGTAAV